MAKDVDVTARGDPQLGGELAYELGELYERRLDDEERALEAYRRAFALDPTSRSNRWALRRVLYRRSLWSDLGKLIEAELRHASDDRERVGLMLERAVVVGHGGADLPARATLEAALEVSPRDQGVLLELERVVRNDRPALLDVREALAGASEHPDRRIAYWLEVARAASGQDYARAMRALNAAAAQGPQLGPAFERIAREQLRLAEIAGVPADIDAAIELLSRTLAGGKPSKVAARRRELVALQRRLAQLSRDVAPVRSWQALQHALALAPDEPVVLVDLIELAIEIDRHADLPLLIQAWLGVETEVGRARMLTAWSAETFLPERRERVRVLLRAMEPAAPGFILLGAVAECDALADPGRVRAQLDLANSYAGLAQAAVAGTWLGAWAQPQPEPRAGAALFVQAAHLLTYHVATPAALEQAGTLLDRALAAMPDHPAVQEALVELDELKGDTGAVLARLHAMAPPTGDRPIVERAIRIAYAHDKTDAVLELQRGLVEMDQSDIRLMWRLEAMLGQYDHHDERAKVIDRIAREDAEPGRKLAALLAAARLHQQRGDIEVATDLYRSVLAESPDDEYARDSLLDLLRTQQRWTELVAERRGGSRTAGDTAGLRRALREAAWVLEVRLHDIARAYQVYDEWQRRIPGDRTALEGIARCSALLRDPAKEVVARELIAQLDDTIDAKWLYASALERAGRFDDAAAAYRQLIDSDDSLVAVTSAMLALGDLAARSGSIEQRVTAAVALANRTTDPRLGTALYEYAGWLYVVGTKDFEQAAESFTQALALQPSRQGALLGAALVAARKDDPVRLGTAYAELAVAIQMPEAASALYLRAAAIAAANGDVLVANERVQSAHELHTKDRNAEFAVAELGPLPPQSEATDPFAAADHYVERANLLERRAELVDDPTARAWWDLDRAEALELAGQLREASVISAAVLQVRPMDWRALTSVRRIAQRVENKLTWAQASYSLARLSRDRDYKLRMLRDAVGVYDRVGPSNNPAYSLAIYRKIAALDPHAKEIARLLEMLRERNDVRGLLEALTERIDLLAASTPVDSVTLTALVFERGLVLDKAGHRDKAALDLDAVLAHAPNHVEALRLRADLAVAAGEKQKAIALWWRYLALDTGGPKRAEIETMLQRALEETGVRVVPPTPAARTRIPTTSPPPSESFEGLLDDPKTAEIPPIDSAAFEAEPTKTNVTPTVATVRRSSPAIIRRGTGQSTPPTNTSETAVDRDPFNEPTVITDVSKLQEAERRAVEAERGPADDYDIEVGGVEPTPIPDKKSVHDVRTELLPDTQMPSLVTQISHRGHPPTTPPPLEHSVTANSAMAAAFGAYPDQMSGPQPTRKLEPPNLDVQALFPARKGPEPSVEIALALDADAIELPEDAPLSPDDSAVVMLSYDQLQPVRADDVAEKALAQYEKELPLADDRESTISLRLEAGRLCEAFGEQDRARAHYEAALQADPREPAAMRALRRISRATAELGDATRLIDAELAIAGPRERDPLRRERIDLLLANNEHDLARVAVGELLDHAPHDIPALFAQLELAFLDDRAEEFARALEQLASAVTDLELRAALQSARAVLAAQAGDGEGIVTWLAAAAESDPTSPATRLGAIRHAAARGEGEAAGLALLDLAYHVEGEDPITAAALAVRSQLWTASAVGSDPATTTTTIAAAAQLAAQAAPRDPLVARIATETGDPKIASHAYARWARCKSVPVERAYAAARAAELEPEKLGRLWAQVLELDPDDDYAAAQLRAAHLAADEDQLAIDLDLAIAATGRDAPLLRAVTLLLDRDPDVAIAALTEARAKRATAPVVAELLAEALAAADRWHDRAVLLTEVAASSERARDVARLHAAFAWDRAVNVTKDPAPATITAALHAWELVLEDDPHAAIAHAATIKLATQLGDRTALVEVLARAQDAERSPWAAASLSLRRARLLAATDLRAAQDAISEVSVELDDPRRTLVLVMAAAQRGALGDAATALETRAAQVEAGGAATEAATLRLRAALLAIDANDVTGGVAMLQRVDQALPGAVVDLLAAARRRANDATPTSPPPADSFVRVLRDADLALRTDRAAALELYERAHELRPSDPLAVVPLVRTALALRDAEAITTLGLEQLRTAEAHGDNAAKADAYELLARVDLELRDNPAAAQTSLESASQADPTRIDLLHRLESQFTVGRKFAELLQLREKQIELVKRAAGDGRSPAGDLVPLIMDAATLAVRAKRPDARLAELYRAALEHDPRQQRALFHLDAILRRAGVSDELAALEERIAELAPDSRTKAAFLTRSGETLVALGRPRDAVLRFARAADTHPYAAALEAWYQTALANELWLDVAEAATRKAAATSDARMAASWHHVAGVALMDKARAVDAAIAALRRASDSDPAHVDTFVRLRMLYETTAKHDDLVALLQRRIDAEREPAAQVELHRALAEHWHGVGNRERATQHYRGMLGIDPADVRAHAAIADIASGGAPEAILARIPLERDPRTLATLHYRLGMLYAATDPAKAIGELRRALAFKPTDLPALIQLTDLAIAAGEWQLALDTCNQLVNAEHDPQQLALHFHRAATILARGFGDRASAEGMLGHAFDRAPTSVDSLRLLLQFYADDPAGRQAQLAKIATVMRTRVIGDPSDGPAYRILSRVLAERDRLAARVAAEAAQLLGVAGDAEQRLLAIPPQADSARLANDEALFTGALEPVLRTMLARLAAPIAKVIGVDVNVHGVSRKDRLDKTDPIVVAARDIAMHYGLKDVEVYVSNRKPYAMVAEPTHPPSLVIGNAIARGDIRGVRFAAGGALKLVQLGLAIPARLTVDELGVLVVAILRLVRPELSNPGASFDEVNALMPKLRRAIPSNLLEEVRSHAAALDSFSPQGLLRDLKIAGMRAGLAASGSLLAGLALLVGPVGADLPGVLKEPIAQDLIAVVLTEN